MGVWKNKETQMRYLFASRLKFQPLVFRNCFKTPDEAKRLEF